MTAENELLPCPFCGIGDLLHLEKDMPRKDNCCVHCFRCGMNGPAFLIGDEAKATHYWNSRPAGRGGEVMSAVLQKQITLDEAALGAIKTFPNGCSYRLIVFPNKTLVEFGCYGVHVNLVQGSERLFLRWFYPGPYPIRGEYQKEIDISPETRQALLAREPCTLCGGNRFIEPQQPAPGRK